MTSAARSNLPLGQPEDEAWVSGAGSVISLLKKIAGAGAASAVTVKDSNDDELLVNADGSINAAITATSLPLPTGAATAANQSTANGHLSNIATVLGAAQVTRGEDAPASNGQGGFPILAIRDDALAADAEVSADGDYTWLRVSNKGAIWNEEAGGTPFYNLDVDESEDAIKATAGVLRELYLFNTTNAIIYVKLYNATTANVTVGTTTPVRTIPVPANNDTDGAGVVLRAPMYFSTAITIAATTGAADNDTTGPGANALIASGVYD